jgi:hypothetical protein
MPRIDDVKESEAKKNNRLLRRTSRVTPGNNQSVTGGRTRFIGLQSLIVIGSQLVSGLLEITGTLEGVGAILWRGSIKVLGLGTLDVAGPAKFSATLDVTAETRLRGKTTLENDLNVKPAGKIVVEGPFAATLENGELAFETGGKVVAYPQGLAMEAGDAEVTASVAGAYLWFGTDHIAVTSGGVSASGDFTTNGKVFLKNLPTISGVSANVTVDPDTGELGVV